ncbi:MAG: 2OG-Fe(II) oxygenase [Burkholderiales bacterium]|jgi:isopenicillin N synthase-like dioxygenase|nr:2OG-Fe(II) oxygenase [Burkholderiales bacterium]
MSKLEQLDFKSANFSRNFAKSLEDTGFAVIKNHPLDQQLIADVFNEWADFFSSNYKNNYIYNNDTQDGLFPMTVSEKAVGYNVKDIKEFYHYYPWGQYPKELSDKTKRLYVQMNAIAVNLLNCVEDNLPERIKDTLSMPLSKMIENSKQTLLRVLHYPPLSGNEEIGAVRASPHGDINLITILITASQAGLQLKDKNGKWLDVPADPGMLAINIGDMLEEATAGFYKSTLHQVINPIDDNRLKSRYSIPLFLHPRPDVVLSEKYTARSFLNERLREIGIKK